MLHPWSIVYLESHTCSSSKKVSLQRRNEVDPPIVVYAKGKHRSFVRSLNDIAETSVTSVIMESKVSGALLL